MTNHKVIYAFEVLEKLKVNGNIYMLDRKNGTVKCVSKMEVADFASILTMAEREKDRFEFWEVINTEDNAE